MEPAIFLAGITGWRCQSEDDRNHWEMYLRHHTVGIGNDCVLLQSLYETQNPTLLQHCLTECDESRTSRVMLSLGMLFCSEASQCRYIVLPGRGTLSMDEKVVN